MILGRSAPSNTEPTVEIEVEPGGGYLTLTPDEFERLTHGDPVKRRSGDCHGDFTIVAQIVRPPLELRCRYSDCAEGHPVADEDAWVTCPRCRHALGLEPIYTLCKHCDHFVDPNDCDEPGVARYVHLEDGEQEFDHDAEPSNLFHVLDDWKRLRPDLFQEHPDGKIGPNSSHHSRRGKIE